MSFLNKIRNLFVKEGQSVSFQISYEENFIVMKPNVQISENDKILDLVNMYNIEEDDNSLYVDYNTIYDLYFDDENNEIDIYKYFNLPSLFRGFIRIENIYNFLQDNRVLFSFEMEAYDGQYEKLNGNIIYCFKTEDLKVLPPKVYELFKVITEYNQDADQNNKVALQFNTLSIIKEYAEEINIVLNQRLRDEEKPIVIDKIKVDFQDDGEVLKVLPILSEDKAINEELINKLYRYDTIRDFYNANVDGRKIKFVIKNKESLNTVIQHKEMKGEDRLKVLSGHSSLFQDDNIDLSEFGPRVVGVGYLNYRSYPAISNNKDLLWREGVVEPPHFYAGSERVVLNPNQLKNLEEKLIDMNKRGETYTEITFKNDKDNLRKVIVTDEQLKNEIIKLQNSIISPTDMKSKEILQEIIEKYDDISTDDNYISIKGKYVEKYDKQYFIDKLSEINNRQKKQKVKGETLLVFENIEKEEYKEENDTREEKLKQAEVSNLLKENIVLFDYQKEALKRLQNLYLSSPINGFLLCDDMGLGKTLQLLSFLSWLKERNELKPSLIVAPTSLLNNWDNQQGDGEIQKFFKEQSFVTKKIRGKVKSEDLIDIKESDLVFITYESLRMNNILLGKVQWNIMICDEAQKIKNPQTLVTVAAKAQNAKFKIVCSATPIENSLIDLWNLVDYSKPGVLGSLKDFKSNYMNRLKNQTEANLEEINNELQIKINPFYIRREKDVLPKSLPIKKIKIYKTKANQYEIDAINQLMHIESNTLSLIQKMLLISNHVDLLADKNLITGEMESIASRSSKLQMLQRILTEIKKKDEKAIIFTRSVKIQHLIYKCIDSWFGMKAKVVNGKVADLDKRTKLLDEFRYENGFNVIILSPEVAGFGITLTEANHVIHFTRLWNPAKEEQASDRAYRIGQNKDVFVHYPILSFNENSVEEFVSPEEYINQYKEISRGGLSPEEKLNVLIARKRNMLLKFFLAVGDTDIDQKEFLEFGDTSLEENKKTITIQDIEIGIVDAFEFEALIAIIFERKGYITFVTTASNDNGVDIVCYKDDEILLVQCKKVQKLNSIDTIKDLLYAKDSYKMHMPNFNYRLVVATNTIEIPQRIQSHKDIEIVDGASINEELKKYDIYKAEIEIKNNDRFSFERIKLKLSTLNDAVVAHNLN